MQYKEILLYKQNVSKKKNCSKVGGRRDMVTGNRYYGLFLN
jgi:hypothetical protein